MSQAYEEALADGRARYLADVATAMVPHNAVAGAMGESFVESMKEVKGTNEEEVGEILEKTAKKLGKEAEDAVGLWAEMGKEFRKEVLEKIAEQDPSANERFAPQLEGLSAEMLANGGDAKGKFDYANAELIAGLNDLLERYKVNLTAAVDSYEAGFKQALGNYRGSVEAVLTEQAEAKAKEEAERKAAEAAAAALEAAALAAPPPVGSYPYNPDAAAAAAAQAQAEAYYAEMRRAQMEADMQRRRAEEAQAAMQAEIYSNRRRRAVRRGLVGGFILAKVLD